MNKATHAATLARNAVALKEGAARRAYLDEACGDDAELRRLVDQWLLPGTAGGATFDFLSEPAATKPTPRPQAK